MIAQDAFVDSAWLQKIKLGTRVTVKDDTPFLGNATTKSMTSSRRRSPNVMSTNERIWSKVE